ncbi:hypothetical protein D1O30_18635 [Methylocystis hirsuta]|uniref:Uncharacterized protein n=1 Tax=Methylocystis hirsuta TaxID=369798 RepID=A0A3M9XU40_9HYPH|nr:hypothetical protein D1O30_18635 [Methylocystis hirsuta]
MSTVLIRHTTIRGNQPNGTLIFQKNIGYVDYPYAAVLEFVDDSTGAHALLRGRRVFKKRRSRARKDCVTRRLRWRLRRLRQHNNLGRSIRQRRHGITEMTFAVFGKL